MATDRTGGNAGVGTKLELAGEKLVHAVILHDEHAQIDRLAADLQPEAPALNTEERRRTPPFGGTAAGDAAAIVGTDHESTLQHRRHHGHTFGRAQYLRGNALVRRPLDFI